MENKKTKDLEKEIKEQKEDLAKLKKSMRRQKWLNVFLIFDK